MASVLTCARGPGVLGAGVCRTSSPQGTLLFIEDSVHPSRDGLSLWPAWWALLLMVHLDLSAGRYWETVQRLKINQFYGAPTAVRLLLKHGDAWVKKYDRSSLRTLGSGESSCWDV